MIDQNIVRQAYRIGRSDREKLSRQKALVLWFTGLSGSGKSTLANAVETALFQQSHLSYLLDGDNIRHGLNSNLDFSEEGRRENIRRIGEVCKLFTDSGVIVLTAFISPFKEDRQRVRTMLQPGEFIEIYVNCPLEVCEQRDVKGLYAKARRGEIANFTGISSAFEAPENPEIEVKTDLNSLEECSRQILDYITPLIKPL